MSAADKAKDYPGIVSLAEVERITDFKVRTLQNYASDHPKKFDAICSGASVIKKRGQK